MSVAVAILQDQVNRFSPRLGTPQVDISGTVDTLTVSLTRSALGFVSSSTDTWGQAETASSQGIDASVMAANLLGGFPNNDVSAVQYVINNADQIGQTLEYGANAMGLPSAASVSPVTWGSNFISDFSDMIFGGKTTSASSSSASPATSTASNSQDVPPTMPSWWATSILNPSSWGTATSYGSAPIPATAAKPPTQAGLPKWLYYAGGLIIAGGAYSAYRSHKKG